MSGYSSNVQDERRHRDFIPHTRPRKEDVLNVACPKCGAAPQQWCRRKGIGKDLKDTARNRLDMANRTPPSHLERYRLRQAGQREISERERRKRHSKPSARPGKRERQALREALIKPPEPDPVPSLLEQVRAVLPAWFAAGEFPTVDELNAGTPEQRCWMELWPLLDHDELPMLAGFSSPPTEPGALR